MFSLLKDVNSTIKEDATGGAISASSVASAPGMLFKGIDDASKVLKRDKNKFKVKKNMFSFIKEADAVSQDPMGNASISQKERSYNPKDIMSKMDQFEKSKSITRDSDVGVVGLEDEDKNVVKLYVKRDHVAALEQELGEILYKYKDEDKPVEIPEIVFELSKKYDIVDADWGSSIVGDEEEEEAAPGQEADVGGEEGGQPGGEMSPDGELPDDTEGMGGEEDAKSALQQVINMMKADAEAKKAEADAKKAEARAKEAEYTYKASENKIKQQEEVLDMEEFNDNKKQEQDEAKKLSMIAKYRHDRSKDDADSVKPFSFESFGDKKNISLNEMAEVIFDAVLNRKKEQK